MADRLKDDSELGKEELLRDTAYERSEIYTILDEMDDRKFMLVYWFAKRLIE